MSALERQEIIMNFGVAPSLDDVLTVAKSVISSIPEELVDICEDLDIDVQDFPDEVTEREQGLDDPYDLLALFKSAKELSPGVEKKEADGNDALVIYRRPILDYWCENGEQFELALRQVIIEEIAVNNGFLDDDIEEMVSRHHQGIL